MDRRIIIAGTHSGAGKTTVALGLMHLFTRKGLKVQPFKVGPDFIDPSHHTAICERPSRNLDSFLLSDATLKHLFQRSAGSADLSIIEGVGGLFDGYSGTDPKGSTAEIALKLDCPVILVCDAYASSRSIAAVVKGFAEFHPKVRLAGVILNRLAGPRHREWCEAAIRQTCKVPVVGALYSSPRLAMRERHMGLIPAAEKKWDAGWIQELSQQMDKNIDFKKVLRISKSRKILDISGDRKVMDQTLIERSRKRSRAVRIGFARDAAFSFYYQDNLDLLSRFGAELVPFSPLKDESLPSDIQGLYIGGGFPEMYGDQLQENRRMSSSIAQAAGRGMPIYAECGGLMYLGNQLKDIHNKSHKMSGILPFSTEMTSRIFMGYVRAKTRRNHVLAEKGTEFPGQIFHFSKMVPEGKIRFAYGLSDGKQTFSDGIAQGNILASYMHVHFWSRPGLAMRFVDRCGDWQGVAA